MATLNDNALTTLAKAELVIPGYTQSSGDDDLVTHYINVASSVFEKAVDRKMYRKSDHVERVEGYGEPVIFVRDHLPVDSITSIEWNNDETVDPLDSDDFALADAETGEIRVVGGVFDSTAYTSVGMVQDDQPGTEQRFWQVTYTGGYITPKQDDDGVGTRDLPWGIEQALIDQVQMLLEQQGKDPAVSKISMDDGSITYGGTVQGMAVTQSFMSAVQQYRFSGVV